MDPPDRPEGGRTLAVYDMQTGEERPIAGGTIGAPTEGIPSLSLRITSDGTKAYWFDVASNATSALYRSNLDRTDLVALRNLPDTAHSLCSCGLLAYIRREPSNAGPATLMIDDLESESIVQVDGFFGSLGGWLLPRANNRGSPPTDHPPSRSS